MVEEMRPNQDLLDERKPLKNALEGYRGRVWYRAQISADL